MKRMNRRVIKEIEPARIEARLSGKRKGGSSGNNCRFEPG